MITPVFCISLELAAFCPRLLCRGDLSHFSMATRVLVGKGVRINHGRIYTRPTPSLRNNSSITLSKEVAKSNFGQYGEMKSRDGKGQREEKNKRERESAERRDRCAKC